MFFVVIPDKEAKGESEYAWENLRQRRERNMSSNWPRVSMSITDGSGLAGSIRLT